MSSTIILQQTNSVPGFQKSLPPQSGGQYCQQQEVLTASRWERKYFSVLKQLQHEQMKHSQEVARNVQKAQQKERRRIGQELHDNINQMLACAQLSIEAIDLQGEDLLMRDKALSIIMKAIEEIRNLSKKMVSSFPGKKDFLGAIQELVDNIALTNIFQISLTDDGSRFEQLDAGRKTALFRIIQEQLNNVIKHSKATQVSIELKCSNGEVHLVVRDNGVGFNTSNIKKGVGLPGISGRASMFNGVAAVRSSVNHGCTLFVRLPFH